jgi:hypothetical protein
MSTREIVVRRTAGAGLNARIAVVSALVVAQFWGLASTLDAWLAGHHAAVPGLVAVDTMQRRTGGGWPAALAS